MSRWEQKRRASDEPEGGSAAGREAKEQGMSGRQGGPRAAHDASGDPGQNPQGSQRVENRTEPEARTGFEAGEAPSEQGRGSPKPDTIAEHQQGIGARSGTHASSPGDTSNAEAMRGEPKDTHARDGRHNAPGDRERE